MNGFHYILFIHSFIEILNSSFFLFTMFRLDTASHDGNLWFVPQRRESICDTNIIVYLHYHHHVVYSIIPCFSRLVLLVAIHIVCCRPQALRGCLHNIVLQWQQNVIVFVFSSHLCKSFS